MIFGRVAQLGERLVRNEEVVGSIPITSKVLAPIGALILPYGRISLRMWSNEEVVVRVPITSKV